VLEKDKPGATIVPIVLSTDKTQLTLFRNKSAYPVYMTIGNIPKEICCKPSCRAYVLLGYLPSTGLENETNAASRRWQIANLYHACMSMILHPLEQAGESGVFITTGNGVTHRCHPLLACFAGDYPEQVLMMATFYGKCPICPVTHDHLGEYNHSTPGTLRDLDHVLSILDSFDENPADFLQTCKAAGVKPVVEPFWRNLPYVNIYCSVTPDMLHQLYQGIAKHVIGWIVRVFGAAEIDAQCRHMLPNHNLRNFMKGISTLSRVTGQEHNQMCRILLGLVIDIPLAGGLSNVQLIQAVQALLDFLYLARYPVHMDETLELLNDTDMLQHRLYTYSNWSGELERRTGAENRSGGDRAERTPTTERVGGIPLPNQIQAETPGMHQTKPHPRSSLHASKWRRCWDTQSV
jgi:Plavaka transposase